MLYSNFTYLFIGVIDYIYYTFDLFVFVGVFGFVSKEYIKENKVIGWLYFYFLLDY